MSRLNDNRKYYFVLVLKSDRYNIIMLSRDKKIKLSLNFISFYHIREQKAVCLPILKIKNNWNLGLTVIT